MDLWIRRLALAGLLLAVAVQASLAQGLPQASPESAGMSGERLERLTEALQGYVDDGRLAGAVTLVARRGKVVYSEGVGYRDRESGAPMTDDVIFRIASQTKAPISVGVLMLQEEGSLSIGDPVGNYLPEYGETTVAEPDGNGRLPCRPGGAPHHHSRPADAHRRHQLRRGTGARGVGGCRHRRLVLRPTATSRSARR